MQFALLPTSLNYFSQDGFGSLLVVVCYVYRISAHISADRIAHLSPIEFSSAGIEMDV